jgi:hypothetical protein
MVFERLARIFGDFGPNAGDSLLKSLFFARIRERTRKLPPALMTFRRGSSSIRKSAALRDSAGSAADFAANPDFRIIGRETVYG